MRGVVESVTRKPHGSVLTTALTVGATVLLVENASDFPDPDEGTTLDVTVNGQTVAYSGVLDADDYASGVTVDTLTLAAAATFAAPLGAPVLVPGNVRYIAQVRVGGATTTEAASIRHGLRKARQLKRVGTLNVPVEVQRDDDGDLWVTALYDEDPDDDAAVLSPETPITPGAVTTSLDTYPDAWQNRVPASALGSGQVSGDIAIRGRMVSGGYGALGRVEHNDHGIFTWQPDGTPRSQQPNDPLLKDQWRGNVDAEQLSVAGGASLYGSSLGGSGGSFQARSVIGPPPTAPTVTQMWVTAQYGGTQFAANKAGLAYRDGTHSYTLIRREGSSTVLAEFNTLTGAYAQAANLQGAPSAPSLVASLGWSATATKIVTLEVVAGAWWVRYYSSPGGGAAAYSSQWQWTDGDPYNGANLPALTVRNVSGVERVTIAQTQTSGTVKLWRYDAHVAITHITSATAYNAGNLAGVANLVSPERYTIAASDAMRDTDGLPCMAIIDAAGTPGASLGTMPVGNGNAVAAGICGDPAGIGSGAATTFYLSAADQSLIQHSDPSQSGQFQVEAAYSNGANKTLPSPPAKFSKIPGSTIVMALGSIPTGATAITWYVAQGAAPTNSDFYLQVGFAGTTLSLQLVTVVLSGANPLTVATLTTGTAFAFKGEDGSTVWDASYSSASSLPSRVGVLEGLVYPVSQQVGATDRDKFVAALAKSYTGSAFGARCYIDIPLAYSTSVAVPKGVYIRTDGCARTVITFSGTGSNAALTWTGSASTDSRLSGGCEPITIKLAGSGGIGALLTDARGIHLEDFRVLGNNATGSTINAGSSGVKVVYTTSGVGSSWNNIRLYAEYCEAGYDLNGSAFTPTWVTRNEFRGYAQTCTFGVRGVSANSNLFEFHTQNCGTGWSLVDCDYNQIYTYCENNTVDFTIDAASFQTTIRGVAGATGTITDSSASTRWYLASFVKLPPLRSPLEWDANGATFLDQPKDERTTAGDTAGNNPRDFYTRDNTAYPTANLVKWLRVQKGVADPQVIFQQPIVLPTKNSLPAASSTYRGAVVYVQGNGSTTADQSWICLRDAASVYAWVQLDNTPAGAGTAPQYDNYTTAGTSTWTKPAGAVRVEVIVIAGGGGGASGRRGAAAGVRCGGGAGGGGLVSRGVFPASVLGATENVSVGAGGAGGAAVTVDATDGNAGANATASYFGASGTRWAQAPLGFGGAAGTATGGAGGAATAPGGSTGAAASLTGGAGTGATGVSRGAQTTGGAGGAGGGITSGNVDSAGGNGSIGSTGTNTPATAGTASSGTAGGAGAAAVANSRQAGVGGAGGGSNSVAAAGAGGAGGGPGGAGGGGGASLNGFNSGAGGAGADGAVFVITYFS